MPYINLTPRWTEILPTWLMMFEQAITGDCTDPDLIRQNAKEELRRMAEAADNFNDLVTELRNMAIGEGKIEAAIERGRAINERERTTVHSNA
jgi:hypothetical protein